MKTKICIYIIILTCIVKSHAQDYQSLNSLRISFFNKQYDNMKCIKIDSVRYDTDSILYPFSNLRKFDYNCYTPYGYSWIGRKVIIQKNGYNVFFNKENDSIKIKTNAKLNETWIAYKIPDSITIVAKVISIDTLKFLNLIDSVKTISFQAYNKVMQPINYDINNLSLALSKNYGFVKILNFSLFPNLEDESSEERQIQNYDLVGLSNPKTGVQNLKWLDVYDFQVGDELHILYESFNYVPVNKNYRTKKKTKLKYLERYDYTDAVVYRIDKEESIFEQIEKEDSTRFTYMHDTIQASYKSDSLFDKLPEEPVINNYATYSNKMHNDNFISKTTPYELYFKSSEFECWSAPFSDGCLSDLTYLKGLGGPYYSCTGTITFCSEDNNIVYYKKGNITGGTPLTITDVKNLISEKNINVYPNPVIDILFVQIGIQDTPCFFELSDMYGKLKIKTEIKTIENSIKLNNIENGVYIYKIVQKGIIVKTGKLIKMNASR